MKAHQLYTAKEMASYLRIHQATLYRIIKRGEVRGLRVGGEWRFEVKEVERQLAASTVAGRPE